MKPGHEVVDLDVDGVRSRMGLAMRTVKVTLKHPGESFLPPLTVEVAIDAERQEVTLSMSEFDSTLIAGFVRHTLPATHGVQAHFRDAAMRARPIAADNSHILFVNIRGRRHPAQVVEMDDGRFTVWLGDPLLDLNRRSNSTACNVLRALHECGVKAVVVGAVVDDSVNEWDPDSSVEIIFLDSTMVASDVSAMRELAQSVATAPVFVSTIHERALPDALRFEFLIWNDDCKRVEERKGIEAL